jgi:hypothetical protein
MTARALRVIALACRIRQLGFFFHLWEFIAIGPVRVVVSMPRLRGDPLSTDQALISTHKRIYLVGEVLVVPKLATYRFQHVQRPFTDTVTPRFPLITCARDILARYEWVLATGWGRLTGQNRTTQDNDPVDLHNITAARRPRVTFGAGRLL